MQTFIYLWLTMLEFICWFGQGLEWSTKTCESEPHCCVVTVRVGTLLLCGQTGLGIDSQTTKSGAASSAAKRCGGQPSRPRATGIGGRPIGIGS